MSPAADGAPARRLAYLNSRYPALSHTFIEREIEAVRGHGFEVHTFSVRASPPEDLLSRTMRTEAESTFVLLGGQPGPWVRAHGTTLTRHLRGALSTIRTALGTGEATPRGRLWQMFYYGEAVVLHDQMRARGLRHIHVHHANVSADVARLTCELGNAVDGPGTWTWSATIHGSAEFENISAWDLPSKIRETHAIACISDFTRGQLMRLVDRSHWDKIHVVRMSVDPDIYVPPATPRSHEGPLRALAVGRLVTLKGFHVLIDAVEVLRRDGVDVEVRIIGQGPDEGVLRAHIAELGLQDHIRLVGPVGQDDIVAHYHWADAYLMTSFMEGLPVVLMEAMATELPVVTTAVAAVGELVRDGQNGHVVRMARVDQLAEAIGRLAADPQERLRLGRAGRAAILEEFTPRTTGPVMADFLRNAVPANA
ncbi:glycosyltransferase family 4 protein [Ornithinimicrobium pratense]|uniref:Glycosyltransferase family 4 protein n=1 Tax=Ornithinimicrobium pratense TaxID=2593973 RepID=A0A5J6V7F7_9MICO|nr:glycosyltransferase family 4 protein [Ornithinimicrobium pratense]QFG69779.1 glycosyltransferase family 4 protein [Ornithinimicrobium pratense]